MFIFPKKDQHSTNVSPTRQPSPGENPNAGKFIFQNSCDLDELEGNRMTNKEKKQAVI